jgi:hypothetical protein
MFSMHLTAWLFFVLLLALSLLKIGGLWWHTIYAVRKGTACSRDFAPFISQWRRQDSVDPRELNSLSVKYGLLFRYEEWWQPRPKALARIPLRLVKALFYVPTLTLGWIALILAQTPSNDIALIISIAILLLLIWSYAAQMFLMRIHLGAIEYFFRVLSTKRSTVEPRGWLTQRHDIVRGYIVVVTAFIALSVLAYAGVYYGLNRLDTKSFKDTKFEGEKQRPMSVVTAVYFSSVTFSTVGFGDVMPVTELARLVVVTQITLSVGFLVLPLLVFSATLAADGC